jgi:class 3 adenylate cyclase
VTFLFTDIEGSRQRWETHGEAMAAVNGREGLRLARGTIARRTAIAIQLRFNI